MLLMVSGIKFTQENPLMLFIYGFIENFDEYVYN